MSTLLKSASAVLSMVAGTAVGARLAEPSRRPAIEVQYLQNSGWRIDTSGHVLVFDAVDSMTSADGDEDLPAALDLADLGDRKVVVFVTHGHADHWSPRVLDWAASRPGIQYVVAEGVDTRGRPAHAMRPHEDWSADGLRVRTTGSTDEGVGFLVNVDGLTVFHAGDLAQWSDGDAKAFEAEIDWLRGLDIAIDIALFPIATGFACEPRSAIWAGVEHAAKVLRPRVLVPMHVRCSGRLALYDRFRSEMAPRLPKTEVVAPSRRGQWFAYDAGSLRPRRE